MEKRNHIPITANISKTDKNVNDIDRLVVICSATESVKLSLLVKNGFTAFRYLNEGSAIAPELKSPIPDTTNPIKIIAQLRIFVLALLNLIIIPEIITKIVGRRIPIPAYPSLITLITSAAPATSATFACVIMNEEVLSKINENIINEAEKDGTVHSMKLSLFLRNGNEKKNNTIGIRKNKIPPHADNPNDKNNAARTNFIKEILPLLNLNPETNRYIATNARKSPSGSDLNQPINPLEKIGIEIEKISAANNPAVVPPRTRTKAKTATDVKEPKTSGMSIVKS